VATETLVQVVLCIYLYYVGSHEGLVYKIDAVDINAAFLKGDVSIPTFKELPMEGLGKLRFVPPGPSHTMAVGHALCVRAPSPALSTCNCFTTTLDEDF
jgi:hypothetical protein